VLRILFYDIKREFVRMRMRAEVRCGERGELQYTTQLHLDITALCKQTILATNQESDQALPLALVLGRRHERDEFLSHHCKVNDAAIIIGHGVIKPYYKRLDLSLHRGPAVRSRHLRSLVIRIKNCASRYVV
jgi:hypothetical protein